MRRLSECVRRRGIVNITRRRICHLKMERALLAVAPERAEVVEWEEGADGTGVTARARVPADTACVRVAAKKWRMAPARRVSA